MHEQLYQLGWQPHFEQQVTDEELQRFQLGRVSAHFGSQVLLLTSGGEVRIPVSVVRSGKRDDPFHEDGNDIAVGDWYLLEPEHHRPIRRLARKSSVSRKAPGTAIRSQVIAANLDSILIVSSCNLDFNLSRLERYLALVLESGAVPIVVLTKKDLHEDPATLRKQAEGLHSGLVVEAVDARQTADVACLYTWCTAGRTVALLGSSGVGKSTLANSLGGHDLLTAEIRQDDDKGRHTTTVRSMHRLAAGGWLIDTPGMRELQLPGCDIGMSEVFQDIAELEQQCRFRNCRHHGDDGCAIETAIQSGTLDSRRWNSYVKLQSEQRRNAMSLAERRQNDRQIGRHYKSVVSAKKNRRRNQHD